MGSGRKTKRPSKYSGISLNEFQPGSRGLVLRNKLGITSKGRMDDIEFIFIHPFREGNGRTIRLLLYLIALQAGFDEFDFGAIDQKGESYQRYIHAIHEALGGNHEPMSKIIKEGLS